ncbi:MAG: 16S rRNA (guanine(527)-N(7))-methyltransferase RsmG [Cyclobacteriaceae bacterium]
MDSSIIHRYFPDLSESQKNQFNALGSIYEEWNAKINVVSRKDIDELYIRHVLHSLAIAKLFEFEKGDRILDIGTGGGFPGIPLAIIFPEAKFHLVDSIGKKINVVKEVSSAIGLKNITAEHNRVEKLKGEYDFIVSRAVAQTKQLMRWTHQIIKRDSPEEVANGYIFLKGGNLKAELNEIRRPHQVTEISRFFKEEFFETKQIVFIPT